MLVTEAGSARARSSGAGYRFPALLWALLHVPIVLALYAGPIRAAVSAAPPEFQAALWPTFLPQALLVGLVAFLAALPASPWPRAYRFVAGGVAGLLAAGLALDAAVYGAVGFHLNGFFLAILLQPTGLRETGIGPLAVAGIAAGALAFVALDAAAGAWFLRRFASPRRTWIPALALLALAFAERTYGQALQHFAGPSVFAASGVLPLQPPIRMSKIMGRVFGARPPDPFKGRDELRLPTGVPPERIRFARTPDVVFVVAESMPAEHLAPDTVPEVWRRSAEGARFLAHYSTASATHYAVFSLVYGIQAQKLEATVGAGRRPMLFNAFRANGYHLGVLAASCVDWMGLKETVFDGVGDALRTWCEVGGYRADRLMVARAREVVAEAGDAPVFLFLFFDGTHFGYDHDPRDSFFTPQWDGQGGIKATTAPGPLIQARARNAARTLDRELAAFLDDMERIRGKAPLVLFTSDHGEEFRQKGKVGHGSDVTREQIHVATALFGPGVPRGAFDAPTSHVDVAATLFGLLGDETPPGLYSDGMDMFQSPPDRFVVATVGWEPRHAVIGKDLKVQMYAGLGSSKITDPDDRPLPDGPARLAASAGKILKAMRGEGAADAGAAAPGQAPATAAGAAGPAGAAAAAGANAGR
jgi:hypothetical protein